MNKICLIGRLTAKPELRYTASNIAYARFTTAVNRNFKSENGEQEADFINCVAWKKTAELIANYFDKGSQIGIEGRLQTGSYEDKDGSKRYTTDVVIDNITFLDKKNQSESVKEEPQKIDPFADFGEAVEIEDNFLD